MLLCISLCSAISSLSCLELGWTNAAESGAIEVCGESDESLGGCSTDIAWEDAIGFCQVAGARLCTALELQNSEALQTGCGIDGEMVWSSSECEGGVTTVTGGGDRPDLGREALVECALESTPHPVRCCADVVTESAPETPAPSVASLSSETPTVAPAVMSSSSCDDLGWVNAALFGDTTVCGESIVGDPALCSQDITWSQAVDFCESAGARVCTAEELENDETRQTGCGGDNQFVWSSSSCDGESYWAVIGSSRNADSVCSEQSNAHMVRCCADIGAANVVAPSASPTLVTSTQAPTTIAITEITTSPSTNPTSAPSQESPSNALATSASTCEELGLTDAADFGSSSICGVSFFDGTGCSDQTSWDNALAFCAASGTRLCTADELSNDEARATGCGLDPELVWSSTECENGHLVTPGASTASTESECVSNEGEHFVRCCADIEPVPTASPTLAISTQAPTATAITAIAPTAQPTAQPTAHPTAQPTEQPTAQPTARATSLLEPVPPPPPAPPPVRPARPNNGGRPRALRGY